MAVTKKKETKALSGAKKSSLKAAKKFNKGIVLLVIALLASIGVYFVLQSYAAEPTSKYDASNYTHCTYFNNIPATPSKGMKASELPTDGGTWCWERNLKYGLAGNAPTNEVLARKSALAAWDAQHPAEWCKWQPDTNPPTIDCSSVGAASSPPSADSSSQSAGSAPSVQSQAGTSSATPGAKSSPSKSTGAKNSGTPKTDGTR